MPAARLRARAEHLELLPLVALECACRVPSRPCTLLPPPVRRRGAVSLTTARPPPPPPQTLDNMLTYGRMLESEQENVKRVQLADAYLDGAVLAGREGSSNTEVRAAASPACAHARRGDSCLPDALLRRAAVY